MSQVLDLALTLAFSSVVQNEYVQENYLTQQDYSTQTLSLGNLLPKLLIKSIHSPFNLDFMPNKVI